MTGHASDGDSAGVPWRGRTLTPQPFAGDTGDPDPALTTALVGYAGGRGDLAGLAGALSAARVFVPIVAVHDPGLDADGAAETLRTSGDAGADMALVTLTGKDGTRALPVFTGTAALGAWDPGARPVPVEAARAAQAAVAEGCDVLLLDLGSPTGALVPRPVVWAIGQGRPWRPPSQDDEVLDGVRRLCADLPEVVRVDADPTESTELDLVVGLAPGLDGAALRRASDAVEARIGGSSLIAERAERVRVRVVRA